MTLFTAVCSLGLCLAALMFEWFGDYSGAGSGFCEAKHEGWIKQPANSWSNLGFMAAGLRMAWLISRDRFASCRNPLTESAFTGLFFSVLTVLLGPGSMAMHASGTRLGGFIDVLSMYLIAGFLVAYSAQRLIGYKTVMFCMVFSGVLGYCLWANHSGYGRIGHLSGGNVAFALSLTTTAVFEVVNSYGRPIRQQRSWGYASLVSILVAFLIWNLSRTGQVWCNPHSIIQGHAIWHLLDAVSVLRFGKSGCVC